MPIVEPEHEDERRREQRINLAKKALLLRERAARMDAHKRITPEDAEAALRAAGMKPEQVPGTETEVELVRLRAALDAGLTAEQAESLKATTPDGVAREIAEMTPGDGGARTFGQKLPPVTGADRNALSSQIAQAEKGGDTEEAWRLKRQLLQTPKNQ